MSHPQPEPEEYFDVVDEHDNVLNQLPRSEVHRRKLMHRAVHIFVFRPDGKLLIHKRPAHKEEFPNVRTSSASGHVSAGEDYDIAAVRELEEELGIRTTGVNQQGRESFPESSNAQPLATDQPGQPPSHLTDASSEKDSRPFPNTSPLPHLERLHKFPPSPATCNEHTVLYRTTTTQPLTTDPHEIEATEWIDIEPLSIQISETPEKYSPAFRLLFNWYETNQSQPEA